MGFSATAAPGVTGASRHKIRTGPIHICVFILSSLFGDGAIISKSVEKINLDLSPFSDEAFLIDQSLNDDAEKGADTVDDHVYQASMTGRFEVLVQFIRNGLKDAD